MASLKAVDDDIIIYSIGGHAHSINKQLTENNAIISEQMNPKENNKVEKEIINPKEVLDNIRKKLTPIEIFVLDNLTTKMGVTR